MFSRSRTYRPGLVARLFASGKWRLTLSSSVPEQVRLNSGGEVGIHCIDIASVSTSKALLWHSVEIRSRGRIDTLSGLSADAAAKLATDLHAFVNDHLSAMIGSEADRLLEVDAKLRVITEGNRQYLAHADLARAIADVSGKAAIALAHPMLDAGMMPAKLKAILPLSFAMLTDPGIRRRYNENFVASELVLFEAFFDDLDGRSLSNQQREACIRLEDANLLVASAGSGKSATMVGKVAYVLEKKLYRPDELKERIARRMGVDERDLESRVTTFHALGRAIIQEVEGRPPQLANWVEHPAGEAQVIEEIIEELVRSDQISPDPGSTC
jgi:DNA helicase-4